MTESTRLATAQFGDGTRNSATQLLIDAIPKVNDADLDVLVDRDGDGYIHTGWSAGNTTDRLGMLDIAKARMIDATYEDE